MTIPKQQFFDNANMFATNHPMHADDRMARLQLETTLAILDDRDGSMTKTHGTKR